MVVLRALLILLGGAAVALAWYAFAKAPTANNLLVSATMTGLVLALGPFWPKRRKH
jgi:hypothetical protein